MDENYFPIRLFTYVFFGFVVLALLLVPLFSIPKDQELFALGKAPQFELLDSEGNLFATKSLKDKVWVVDFFFTTCSDICPIMTNNLKKIKGNYFDNDNFHVVSITVNPEFDTPLILKNYKKKYLIDTSQWHFLTGGREKIKEISVKGFKLGSVDDPVFHSGRMVLVDQKREIRGYFDGTDKEGIKKLNLAIGKLLKK